MGPEALLEAQVDAWNRGDLDGFCDLCTEDVVYVGAAGLLRGREAVRDGYRRRYPDRTSMGTLSLQILTVDLQGDAAAVITARWAVSGHGGHALLVLVRQDAGWRLSHDATIAAQSP